MPVLSLMQALGHAYLRKFEEILGQVLIKAYRSFNTMRQRGCTVASKKKAEKLSSLIFQEVIEQNNTTNSNKQTRQFMIYSHICLYGKGQWQALPTA
jgi:hypothetical protein